MLNIVQGNAPANRKIATSPAEREATERARLEEWLAQRINSPEPISEVVTITPALAAMLIARNADNRSVSEINLDRIKRDIVGGRYTLNGEPIVVASDGHLNDGQHRLHAVMETGRSIRSFITFGVERDSRFTVNQGVIRTAGNYLGMNGFERANSLAAAATHAWQYKTHQKLSRSGSLRPTKTEVRDTVKNYRQIAESLIAVSVPGAGALCGVSMLAFAHFAISEVAAETKVRDFFEKLISGAGLSKENPILYVRNRLIAMRGDPDPNAKAALIFGAWNLWSKGLTITAPRKKGDDEEVQSGVDGSVSRLMVTARLPKLER